MTCLWWVLEHVDVDYLGFESLELVPVSVLEIQKAM